MKNFFIFLTIVTVACTTQAMQTEKPTPLASGITVILGSKYLQPRFRNVTEKSQIKTTYEEQGSGQTE